MEELRLHDAVVYLAAAGLVVPLAKRLRISPVLGFMLIGLALGPHGLGRLTGRACSMHNRSRTSRWSSMRLW